MQLAVEADSTPRKQGDIMTENGVKLFPASLAVRLKSSSRRKEAPNSDWCSKKNEPRYLGCYENWSFLNRLFSSSSSPPDLAAAAKNIATSNILLAFQKWRATMGAVPNNDFKRERAISRDALNEGTFSSRTCHKGVVKRKVRFGVKAETNA
jgi:hypothetical protein